MNWNGAQAPDVIIFSCYDEHISPAYIITIKVGDIFFLQEKLITSGACGMELYIHAIQVICEFAAEIFEEFFILIFFPFNFGKYVMVMINLS